MNEGAARVMTLGHIPVILHVDSNVMPTGPVVRLSFDCDYVSHQRKRDGLGFKDADADASSGVQMEGRQSGYTRKSRAARLSRQEGKELVTSLLQCEHQKAK